jgi:hypothetical protein
VIGDSDDARGHHGERGIAEPSPLASEQQLALRRLDHAAGGIRLRGWTPGGAPTERQSGQQDLSDMVLEDLRRLRRAA